ncbi:MAG TPA: molybdopterin-dependent oxidoreductase [Acidimicrobiia bacterium]
MTAYVTVEGLVTHRADLTAGDLESLGGVGEDAGEVAGGAAGRAVAVGKLIEAADPLEQATHCTVISADETYRASIPLADLVEGGWLAFAIGDGPLPVGGPFRLTVAKGSTLCWNVKNVGTLRLTSGPEPDDVPESPLH